jgi:hypothetical protein
MSSDASPPSTANRDATWRLLVVAAPLPGVGLLAAAIRGGSWLARPALAGGLLALVAGLGAAVAWSTFRRRRAASTVSIGRAGELARAGSSGALVALSGRARALPDAPPLVSPGGELCLWFRRDAGGTEGTGDASGRGGAVDSARPFLLVDASGRCVVLPEGAVVVGGGPTHAGEAVDGPGRERLLRDGDRVRVIGRFLPASAEAQALHARGAARAARGERASAVVISSNDPAAYSRTRADAARGLPLAEADPLPAAAPAAPGLPVVAAPGGSLPFAIRIGPDADAGDLFGVFAILDALVLLAAAGLSAWACLASA